MLRPPSLGLREVRMNEGNGETDNYSRFTHYTRNSSRSRSCRIGLMEFLSSLLPLALWH